MIEVGEYVRTKNGSIGKIIKVGDEFSYDYIYRSGKESYAIDRNEIVKHSKNIIDLIEVGDYVNGEKVVEIHRDREHPIVYLEHWEDYIFNNEIHTIVTKEQFESVKYEVNMEEV